MTQIPVDKAFLEDLVDLKSQLLTEKVDKILSKRGYGFPTQLFRFPR